ncbi:MAG TPA: biopolymer transporter ExbD [Polyangiales bacterium]|nr:biopolymer transporter ExbD [Polyangiales bacterium]
MPVRQPGRALLRSVPLDFVSQKVTGHGAKPVDVTLALIPIIDLMICLVVFLLMSFSSSGELLAQKASINLPKADHAGELAIAPVIAVDAVVVTLDGRRIADTPSLASEAKVERIEPLIQDLETLKRNWGILHPQDAFPGRVTLQADVSTDYRVIKKLMFAAAQAGYAEVSFAVNRSGKK